jgi:hypothetical protein
MLPTMSLYLALDGSIIPSSGLKRILELWSGFLPYCALRALSGEAAHDVGKRMVLPSLALG